MIEGCGASWKRSCYC